MGDEKRVRYLKIDRGRFYYQRRVPLDLQPLLGPRWLISCGDVSFAKAVQIIVTQAEEHDQLVASLRTEDGRAKFLTEQDQADDALFEVWAKQLDPTAKRLVQMPGDDDHVRIDGSPDSWRSVSALLLNLDRERAGDIPGSDLVGAFYRDIATASRNGEGVQQIIAPDFKMFRDLAHLSRLHRQLIQRSRLSQAPLALC